MESLSYFPANYAELPEFGQFYGKSVTLNIEALIEANPDVIIDLGDKKPTHAEDMDGIQKKTGIPTIFIEANLATFAAAYRTLGTLLEVNDQAEACAAYIDKTVEMGTNHAAKLAAEDQISVMFGTGPTGRDCNAKGSIHADVIELIGATNAIEVPELSNKGGGNTISMEELLRFQPEVILLANNGPYESVATDAEWAGLSAVQQNRVYEIPYGPYDFLSNPPSVNRMIGIRWLGNLLYPELYDLDMVDEVKTFYRLFWHSEVTEDQIQGLLKNSTFKEAQP
jgi:iron complex transport system substrate-binding protein